MTPARLAALTRASRAKHPKSLGLSPRTYYLVRFDIRSHSQPSSSRPSSFPLARPEPHPLQGGMLTWYVGHCNCQMQEGGGECQLGPSVTLVLQTCLAVYRRSTLGRLLRHAQVYLEAKIASLSLSLLCLSLYSKDSQMVQSFWYALVSWLLRAADSMRIWL
jgi:hypothetical protein